MCVCRKWSSGHHKGNQQPSCQSSHITNHTVIFWRRDVTNQSSVFKSLLLSYRQTCSHASSMQNYIYMSVTDLSSPAVHLPALAGGVMPFGWCQSVLYGWVMAEWLARWLPLWVVKYVFEFQKSWIRNHPPSLYYFFTFITTSNM